MTPPVLLVEGLGKRFCGNLRRSMAYGLRDLMASLRAGRRTPTQTCRPGEYWSLRDIDFELAPGECLAVLGANGAGKSTLLKILAGILAPDTGRVEVRGRVGSLIEIGAGFHPLLTGRENIYINGSILGMGRAEIDRKFDSIVDFAGIGDFLDSPVKFYSSGMYVRLGFAVAAHTEPHLLLVDEVLAVGDLAFRMRCLQRVRELRESGTSILVVSHNHLDLARVAQRGLVLDRGTACYQGNLRDSVTRYHEILQKHSPDEQRPKSCARIECVRLVDSEGNASNGFQTGEELSVEIELSTDEDVKDARLIAAVESPDLGVLGSVASPHTRFALDLDAPGASIRLALQDVPLLAGSYAINLSLYGARDEDVLDRVVHAVRFRIEGPDLGRVGFGLTGNVRFRHRWERIEDPAC